VSRRTACVQIPSPGDGQSIDDLYRVAAYITATPGDDAHRAEFRRLVAIRWPKPTQPERHVP
jgi:hypothetical protein